MTFEIDEIEIKDVPEPVEVKPPKKEPEKKKKKRKKPTWSETRYKRNPLAKLISKKITDFTNKVTLKDYKGKIKRDDVLFGEAIVYTVEYYGAVDINHPAFVLVSAGLGYFLAVEGAKAQGKKKTAPTEPSKKRTEEPRVDEVA